MKQKLLLIIGFLFILCLTCYAEDKDNIDKGMNDQKDLPKFCELVISNFQKDDINTAFDLMKQQYPLSSSDFDSFQATTIQQWDFVQKRYGNLLDYKLLKVEEIKDEGLIKYLYLLRFDNCVLRFTFLFYKPKTKWFLVAFTWDDKITNLFSF